ncbi:hypothetical protein GYMLUDRAFT_75815 [Collybiopsis luxurians FD-317 M1]|uniref:Uncharacterized protein n=1 Tax=Collybiopsis luxurians FD-317 M1 TaxID=944289 RepID=A0A0D0C3P7_9AGAR|nr:hypothetical protein GYMLUDRAFT_75815 [Collybiopsis luxurians FD-317 M1]
MYFPSTFLHLFFLFILGIFSTTSAIPAPIHDVEARDTLYARAPPTITVINPKDSTKAVANDDHAKTGIVELLNEAAEAKKIIPIAPVLASKVKWPKEGLKESADANGFLTFEVQIKQGSEKHNYRGVSYGPGKASQGRVVDADENVQITGATPSLKKKPKSDNLRGQGEGSGTQ